MHDVLIIGLSGKRGSGKGFATQVLKDHFAGKGLGVTTFKFSDVLGSMLDNAHKPRTQENYNELFLETESSNPNFMTTRLEDKIKHSRGVLIIDGIRQIPQAEVVKKHGGIIFCISADDRKRYSMVVQRNEKMGDKNITYEDFLKDERSLANNNIDSIQSHCNEIITNDYTKQFKGELIDATSRALLTRFLD